MTSLKNVAKKESDDMLHFEIGASEVLNPVLDAYTEQFGDDFPLYEYLNVTRNDEYDISVTGAKRLVDLIKQSISQNRPVPKPDDYDDRVY